MTMHVAAGRSVPPRAEAPPPALVVRDVSVRYPNGHAALRHVTFDLAFGSICGLVGVNGSGKSTLFKAIMGFVAPATGEVRIDGGGVAEAVRANRIAYVPQSEEIDWTFPVLVDDVVMMGRYGRMGFLRRPNPADRAAVTDALVRVGMTEFRRRQIGELSGGQRKRVFLARALAQDAQIVLLDEPFTGVDVKTEQAIVDLMRELRTQGRLLLVSTHNLGSVPEYCDHVVLINRRLIAAGPTAQTFTQANLEAAFGGVLRHFRLTGDALHDDADARSLTVLTDDERPVVFYGTHGDEAPKGPTPAPPPSPALPDPKP
jgi:manganese/iron transport system ATP-binding protein